MIYFRLKNDLYGTLFIRCCAQEFWERLELDRNDTYGPIYRYRCANCGWQGTYFQWRETEVDAHTQMKLSLRKIQRTNL